MLYWTVRCKRLAWITCVSVNMVFSAPINTPQQESRAKFWTDERMVQKLDNLLSKSASRLKQGRHKVENGSVDDEDTLLPMDRYLFEGDIVLSRDQAVHLLGESGNSRISRAAATTTNKRWETMPIHYVFHQTLNSFQIQVIEQAVEYWQSHTCVTFSRITEANADRDMKGDFLVFHRGDGCFSMVGRAGGAQGISVGDRCTKIGQVAHEIGHALGLWHEQSRPDSSCCIKVIEKNIQSGLQINFLQRDTTETETYGLPYDLGSVMHYRSNAFAIDDNLHTIETVEPGYQRTIGQRVEPSFIDVLAINKAYCNNKCTQSLPCQYGGYAHPSSCNTCLCPQGLGGQHCEREAPAINAACGGVIQVTSTWTFITSPNYPRPYGVNQRCNWLIKASSQTRIRLEFEHFDLFCNQVTCVDYVEVKLDKSQFPKTGMRYCCKDTPPVVHSVSDEMLVIFNSEFNNYPGFSAKVIQVPASG